ncbi:MULTISPECIES: hypothetical protein [Gammaproteobacteria]|uniref:DUF115 domain-containing protein n=1 Tax=Marinobacter litoralis TaxID=187981 RepID=A0A3M2RFI2_9GAMM|nr:hypothetical protein [Marinobacter litoralis]RMJ03924.1 hypothetical protein DOQ08_01244 [Marinobacter litoralis]
MSRLVKYAVRFFLSFLPSQSRHASIAPLEDRKPSLVILANGPGLSHYIEGLSEPEASTDSMCVNLFALNSNFEFFKPRHYVIFDPLFVVGLDDPDSMASKVFRSIHSKLSWHMTLYIPLRFKGYEAQIEKLASVEKLRIVYFRDAGLPLDGGATTLWLMDKQVIMPRAQNVLVAAIYIGILLGYPKIFLEGADHSWHRYLHLNDENKLMIKDVHFYDGNPKMTPLLKDAENRVHFSVEDIFRAYYLLHKSYRVLAKISKRRGVQVINRTPDSFIDAFQKKQ